MFTKYQNNYVRFEHQIGVITVSVSEEDRLLLSLMAGAWASDGKQ